VDDWMEVPGKGRWEDDAEIKARNDKRFYEIATWKHKRSWRWRKCYGSGKRIALNEGSYQGKQRISGPGSDVIVEHWLTEEEYTFKMLRGELNG